MNQTSSLRSLPKAQLIQSAKEAVKKEKDATLLVLSHLREIQSRRLYLDFGYSSLFEMATQYFGYCSASAQRRIEAMRIVKDLPQVAKQIEQGELTLTSAASLQTFFRQEKKDQKTYSKEMKMQVVSACLNKSTREVEKELAKRRPESDRRDDVRYTKESRLRLSLNISEELFQKLEELKTPGMTTEQVIEFLADRELKRRTSGAGNEAKPFISGAGSEISAAEPPASAQAQVSAQLQPTRYIRATTKRIVVRENNQKGCEYKDLVTQEPCGEKAKLQFDHITPHSKGGPNIAKNLRLLCAHHNNFVWHHEQKNVAADSLPE